MPILLKFDVHKLYDLSLTLSEICVKILESDPLFEKCLPSPNSMGIIEVHLNDEMIEQKLKKYKKLGTLVKHIGGDDKLMDEIYRFIVSNLVETKVCGVCGIAKFNTKEVTTAFAGGAPVGEYVADISFQTPYMYGKQQRHEFLNILTAETTNSETTICNDFWSILEIYGIEAARKYWLDEIYTVISFDGLYVNPRFFQTLANAVTHTGVMTSVSQNGISHDAVGPNAKIMFERASEHITLASLFGEMDTLTAMNSCVMYGKSTRAGTGSVTIES